MDINRDATEWFTMSDGTMVGIVYGVDSITKEPKAYIGNWS